MRRVLLAVALFGVAVALFGAAGAAEEKLLEPGWLSLDGSVGLVDDSVARAKSSLEDALGLSISGFLDAGYNWSSNHPKNPRNISGRYFDKDYDKLVFNNFHVMVEKPEADWGVGFRLSGDFGRTGELLREATLWGKTLHKEPSAELREAYLTTTVPVGAGLQLKGGLFVTTHGAEVIPAPNAYNENISRSFLFNLAIPLRHLGVMASYPLADVLAVSAGVVTGWDNPRDNNNAPSGMLGVSFTPADAFVLASNVMYGAEQTDRSGPKRFLWSNVATIKPVDRLTLFVEYAYGHEEDVTPSGRDGTWHAVAGTASLGWTDRFATALRGEIFNDRDGARTGGELVGSNKNVNLAELTLTGSYKFTRMFLGRAEVRQDWADERFYKKGGSKADKNQTTLGFQLIYAF